MTTCPSQETSAVTTSVGRRWGREARPGEGSHIGGDDLSLLVDPLHSGSGEEGKDESERSHQVAREGVDDRELLK